MSRVSVTLLCLLLSACGSAEAPAPPSAPSEPPAPIDPAPVVPPTPAEPSSADALPADFRLSAHGGPVAGEMAAGMTRTSYSLEPGAAPGTFALVGSTTTLDSEGFPSAAATAIAPIPVPRERVGQSTLTSTRTSLRSRRPA